MKASRAGRRGRRRSFWRSSLPLGREHLAGHLRRLRIEQLEQRTLLSIQQWLPEMLAIDSDGHLASAEKVETLPDGVDPKDFPTSYDLRDVNGVSYVTPVKDQGDCGSCWAFATFASLESNILVNGGPAEDFSEHHLIANHPFDWDECETGKPQLALCQLAGGHDPEDESEYPYPYKASAATSGVTSLDTIEYYVREGLFFDTMAEIKNAIIARGALYFSMHVDWPCFDPTMEYYYYSGEEETNHCVVIVGWDDEIDMSVVGAPEPGAWLIRNSWGPESHGDGYFWLSYNDHYGGLSGEFSIVSYSDPVPQPETFLRVYDYDDFGAVYSKNNPFAFNAFTAAGNEILTAVNFWTMADGASYDLRIYDMFSSGSLSGLLSQKTGTATYWGNHTVDLADPVELAPGDDFYVYVHITDGGTHPHASDARLDGYSSSCTANPGESFRSFDGDVWYDLQLVDETSNFCIKALTSPLPEVYDFGDAPESYGTLLDADGARHRIVPGFHLGQGVDAEEDGQPDPKAEGDDKNGTDDEDGVRFLGPLMPGRTAWLVVTASQAGLLGGWIDFNGDGDWKDDGERVFAGDASLRPGGNPRWFKVPSWAKITEKTFARFRFSGDILDGPGGPATGGEVEDYAVEIVAAGPSTFYVDDSAVGGANNGTSWEDAFIELQDALWAAESGDQIWVAQGTYLPDWDGLSHTGKREATFWLENGVEIRGGYAGAADPDARDVHAYETILSGEIGDLGQTTDNSFHVVTGSWRDKTAVLEGFTIIAGYCAGSDFPAEEEPNYCGAGMLNRQGSPTVSQCKFTENVAYGGAGMANYQNASPEVTDCTFTSNEAQLGGGMMNFDGSSPRVDDCKFLENVASRNGGGMLNGKYSQPVVVNCTFDANLALDGGGGLNNGDHANAWIANCRFLRNTALTSGGGMQNLSSSPVLVNCTFSVNSAGLGGGGLFNYGSKPTIASCTFSGNQATGGGGLVNMSGSGPTIWNSIFWQNVADATGEQIWNDSSTASIGWCDIEGGLDGGVLNLQGGSVFDAGGNLDADPMFVVPPDPGDDQPGDLRLQAGSPLVDRGNALPEALPNDFADLDGDFDTNEPTSKDLSGMADRLIDSPAVEPNKGMGDPLPLLQRPPVLDIGAYECIAGVTKATVEGRLFSDLDSDGEPDADEPGLVGWKVYLEKEEDGDGQWQEGEPYRRTDADGLYALTDIEPGTYTLRQVREPGWEQTCPNDPGTYTLTLSAGGAVSGQDFGNHALTSSQNVLYVDQSAVEGANDGTGWQDAYLDLQAALEAAAAAGTPIDIYVAQGRYVPTAQTSPEDPRTATFQLLSGVGLYGGFPAGGGAFDQRDPDQYETILSGDFIGDDEPDFTNYAENAYHVVTASGVDATAVLDGLFISGGYSGYYSPDKVGGGLFNEGGSPTLNGCTFKANYARASGGGMYNESSNLSLTDCTFEDNKVSDLGGGGMHNVGTQVTLTDCIFKANLSDRRAAGVYNDEGVIVMTGCRFDENSGYSGNYGGVIYSVGSTLLLTSCHFTANRHPVGNHDCNVTIAGCTFENNLTSSGEGRVVSNSGTTTAELRGCMFRNNGRAVFSQDEAAVTVVDCDFIANSGRSGAGLNHTGSGSLTVANCEFLGNSSGPRVGGGMYLEASDTVLVANSTFIGNSGGMYVTNSPQVTIANCTFAGNHAGGAYGLQASDCSPTVANSILWENAVRGGTYSHCDIQGCGGSGEENWDPDCGTDAGGNIDLDPLLGQQPDAGPDGAWGTDDDQINVCLRAGSPAIDAGNNHAVPPDTADLDHDGDTVELTPVDLDGRPRRLDNVAPDTGLGTPPIVDMGAYEQQNADAGDAPAPYPTTGPDGAYHTIVEGVHLGAAVDSDPGGQPTFYADGDDLAETDDEDGVQFLDPLETGRQVTIVVTASQSGFLDAWIDFNDDGDWDDEGEQIFLSEPLSPDENKLSFSVPAAATPTELTYGRFRFSTEGFLSPGGYAADGEVEDYQLVIRRCDGQIHYVDEHATGTGTGVDWPNAYRDLQSALEKVIPGDQIWVAEGTYAPSVETDATDVRTVTFQLKRGVEIYGGFPEAGGGWDDRDPADHKTTLSGDVGASGESADNAYHVVTVTGTDATAVLDGFTITAGLADGLGPHDRGGGILAADHADLTIGNCIVLANGGTSAAGMYLGSGSPLIAASRFQQNSAETSGAGGLWCTAASPSISDCIFEGNYARGRGGAIWCTDGSRPQLTTCQFLSNRSSSIGEGAGIASEDSFPNIENCVFEENLGRTGGAFYNGGNSVAVVAGSTFCGNQAQTSFYGVGGAIQNADAASATVVNCTFTANSGYKRGGGGAIAHGASGELVVVNGFFQANSGGLQWNRGGAILHNGSGPLSLANSVFVANMPGGGHGAGVALVGEGRATVAGCTFTAHSQAEALMLGEQGPRTVVNTILWANPGGQVGGDTGTTTFAYCDVEGCGGSGVDWWGVGNDDGGNIDANPLFVGLPDPGPDGWGTEDDDYGDLRLQETSPAVDAGDNVRVPLDAADIDFDGITDEPTPRDLDFKPRFSDVPEVVDTGNGAPPIVDMGAYERPVLDFGDAPLPYPTIGDLAACHGVVTGFYLGQAIDSEEEGQPGAYALGDDNDDDGDDEDGVCFVGPLQVNREGTVVVTASAEGYLDAWIDFGNDGAWSADDRIFSAEHLDAGEKTLSFAVPAGTEPTNQTFARFRFSSTGNLDPGGLGVDGEVEDYEVAILPASAQEFFVDDTATTGADNGESWQDAFLDLRDALSVAVDGDVIYVAAGTYRPSLETEPGESRSATFQLKTGVTLYGGFPDGGADFGERDWDANVAKLSGDLGTEGDPADNAWHVVTGSGADATAVLDGFTITAGNADGAGPHDAGGGMFVEDGSPNLLNCTFDANAAGRGGALAALAGAAPVLVGCVLTDNDGTDGGAVFIDASEATLTDCRLEANQATGSGGGVYNAGTLTVEKNSEFSTNQADGDGGAIWNVGGSLTITETTFQANQADSGGAIALGGAAVVRIIDATFRENTADANGGAFCNLEDSDDIRLTNVLFEGNHATATGGAIYNLGTIFVANAVFCGNAAETHGGGLANSGTVSVANATITGNTAGGSGGAVYSTGTTALANVILWADSAGDQGHEVFYSDGEVSFRYCDVEGGLAAPSVDTSGSGTMNDLDGNRTDDPEFSVLPNPGAGDYGDLRLEPASQLIDAGDNDAVPDDLDDLDGNGTTDEPLPLDLAHTPRFADKTDTDDTGNAGELGPPIVDIGAYEWGLMIREGTIQGRAWNDLNVNGTPDPDELGIEGRRIFLDLNGNGQHDSDEPQEQTDADGYYTLAGIPPETYTVAQELPTGWGATFPPFTGVYTFTLLPGQVQIAHFGSRPVDPRGAEIRGRKIRDRDGDGEPDLGQTGLANWEIYLDVNDNTEHDRDEPITLTGPDGSYAFTGLAADTYIVRELARPGWQQTYPADGAPYVVDLAAGEIVEGRNFLNQPLEPPLAGIFVDDTAGGTNTGLSWKNAFTDLQSALNVASPGDRIYVAEGTYKPSVQFEPGGPYSVTFRPTSDVELYGGFPDGGGLASERDPNANPTVLSGDLAGNDGPNWTNRFDNAFRVVVCQQVEGVVIDGFGITGGQAEGRDAQGRITCGAGLHVRMASVAVRNCTFWHNRAGGQGGAMSVYGVPANPSAATLINCRFVENVNSSATWGGGGLYTLWEAAVEVIGCEFSRNTASNGSGGAMTNDSSQVAVTNCTFLGNKAARFGGGMYNAAQYGTSHGTAGAAHSPLITNCAFVGNTAGNSGGGMTNDIGTRPVLTNCTLSANGAGVHGGALHTISGGTWQLASNCIFWNNTSYVRYWHTGNELSSGPPPQPRYDYCIIRDAEIYPGAYSGVNIRATDPQFVRAPQPGDDGVWGTADDDYGDLRLQSSSPAIDAGNDFDVPADLCDIDGDGNRAERLPLDLDGSARFVDDPSVANTGWPQNGWPLVDLGAFESHHLPPSDVNGDGHLNTFDVIDMTASFGSSSACDEWDPLCDFNGDHMTNTLDLFVLSDQWGQSKQAKRSTIESSGRELEPGSRSQDPEAKSEKRGTLAETYEPSLGLTIVPYVDGAPMAPNVDGQYELNVGDELELRIFAQDLRDDPQGVVLAAMDVTWAGANFQLLSDIPLVDLDGTTVHDARSILGGGESGQASPFDNWFTCGAAEEKTVPFLGKLGGLAALDTDGAGVDGLGEFFAAATLGVTVPDPADGEPMPHLAPLAGAGTAEAALLADIRLQAATPTGDGEIATIALDRWENEALLAALYDAADPSSPLPLTHYGVALPEPLEFVIVVDASNVVGQHIFYNNSYWDTPTAEHPSINDDTAIALDKWALQPGGTAIFENHTSYSRGINGIMVDMGGLPSAEGPIDPADYFEFKVGNHDDPAGWASYTVVPTATVRPGEGVDFSDRVTLVWPDYDPSSPETTAVAGQWLEVTVLANEHTGLAEQHVFYFGNAIGETGDSTVHARVDANDVLLTRNSPHPFFDPADIYCEYDFNRDGRVDTHDIVIARNHQTTFFDELALITVPPVRKPGDADLDRDVDFSDFNNLANNYTGSGGVGKIWAHGDFDGDGDVDFADFNALANNYTGALGKGSLDLSLALSQGSKRADGPQAPIETWPGKDPSASQPRQRVSRDSASVERAAARDAVLEQAAQQESNRRTSSPAKADWLWQFEAENARGRTPKRSSSVETAVDVLLSTRRR